MEWSVPHTAWFSLAWFVVGVMVGATVPKLWTKASKASGRRSKGPRTRRKSTSGAVEIYVGNLAYSVSNQDLTKAFRRHGDVVDVRIIRNKANGKSKGYGFVEMADRQSADDAISEMNGAEVKGRRIVVNEAKSGAR